jgi:hypothetical protein
MWTIKAELRKILEKNFHGPTWVGYKPNDQKDSNQK